MYFCFVYIIALIGIGKGKVTLIKGEKTLLKFAELSSIENKKLLVKCLGTKFEKLYPEDDEDNEIADN